MDIVWIFDIKFILCKSLKVLLQKYRSSRRPQGQAAAWRDVLKIMASFG
jgi:hypothetical protein